MCSDETERKNLPEAERIARHIKDSLWLDSAEEGEALIRVMAEYDRRGSEIAQLRAESCSECGACFGRPSCGRCAGTGFRGLDLIVSAAKERDEAIELLRELVTLNDDHGGQSSFLADWT
jgi:heterodisulfide reductase subunit C